MCRFAEYINYQRSKLGYRRNTFNATTQQFITAEISGCVSKQRCKTHSSLRQSHLQLRIEAALMPCQIRAVEHKKCAAGLAGTHPGCQDQILLNYTRMDNAHKAHKKTFVFCYEAYRSPAHFVFFFPAETLSSA